MLQGSQRIIKSKLGSHINQPYRGLGDKIIKSGCKHAFVNADMGFAAKLTQAGVLVTTRHWKAAGEDDAGRLGVWDNPKEAAERWWEATLPELEVFKRSGGNTNLLYWQAVNEPHPSDQQQAVKLNDFEMYRMDILNEEGNKGALYAFSAGTPRIDQWGYYLPSLVKAQEEGHILALHEYYPALPWIWYGVNQDSFLTHNQAIPYKPYEYNYGWLALRYRRVMEDWLYPHNLFGLKIHITEAGSDFVGTTEAVIAELKGQIPTAWKNIDYNSLLGMSQDDGFLYTLKWLDAQLSGDLPIIGACVFADGGGPSWQDYDIRGYVSDKMYGWIANQDLSEVLASGRIP